MEGEEKGEEKEKEHTELVLKDGLWNRQAGLRTTPYQTDHNIADGGRARLGEYTTIDNCAIF